jgi:hypothetical protein
MTNHCITPCPLEAQRASDPTTPPCELRESIEYSGGRQIVQTTCGACGSGCSRWLPAEAATNEPPAASLADATEELTDVPPEHPRRPKRKFLR